ncbi:MAG: MBL fold metallo-hydrolase [Acidobacteria bacterium]|nr:MBL fold metallo-hydrolase [Acidobacteriota bacterium]
MKRLLLAVPFLLLAGFALETRQTATHKFEEIAAGVFFVTGGDKVVVGSNSLVVVNDDDVLVVDSHITPEAARALIASVKTITNKPIRTLVNSHYHYDHANGNQVFGKDVEIIGHEYTRRKLLGDVLHEATFLNNGSVATQERVAAGIEEQIQKASGVQKTALEARLALQRRHIQEIGEVKPTPPNVTLTNRMTLHRGSREIQLLHLGRAHTAGDVAVYLPADQIIFTGDMFYRGAPYLGDGFPDEFVQTLERLKGMDWKMAVGGHGPLIRDRAQVDFNQQYLREYWGQVKGFHAAKMTKEQARGKLDLSKYKDFARFQLTAPGVLEIEVGRMYNLLNGVRD